MIVHLLVIPTSPIDRFRPVGSIRPLPVVACGRRFVPTTTEVSRATCKRCLAALPPGLDYPGRRIR